MTAFERGRSNPMAMLGRPSTFNLQYSGRIPSKRVTFWHIRPRHSVEPACPETMKAAYGLEEVCGTQPGARSGAVRAPR